MDIWNLLEAIQHSASYVGYTFADNPKDYGESACVVERLEGHKDGQSHQHIACCLKIALSLHLAEAKSCSDHCTQPYESEYHPRPDRFACRTHGYERKRGVAACDMPVDGCVVELSCDFLGLLSRCRYRVING